MKDEIKEILYLEKYIDKYKSDEKSIINGNRLTTPAMLDYLEVKDLLDYITNLQEENERLKEENKHIFANVNDDQLLRSNAMNYAELQDYKTRNDKAVDMLNLIIPELWNISNAMTYKIQDVRRVLQGKSDE